MKVSVLTPTIPGREWFLEECMASVDAQMFDSHEHLIQLDEERQGCSITMNALADKARGDWYFPLADDDLLLPRALQILHEAALFHHADIVYQTPLVWGEPVHQFHQYPPAITSGSLIRASLWHELGGYNPVLPAREDRDFYTRALERGAVFYRMDQHPVFVYRFHGGNKSRA